MIVFHSLPTFPVWVPQTMQLAPRVSTQRITSRITLLPVFWWALARNVPSCLFRPEESVWFLCVPVCPCSILHQSYVTVTVFPRLYCTNVASARPSDFRRWSCCLMVFLFRTPRVGYPLNLICPQKSWWKSSPHWLLIESCQFSMSVT